MAPFEAIRGPQLAGAWYVPVVETEDEEFPASRPIIGEGPTTTAAADTAW